MEGDIRQLDPKALWNHFADLYTIPRHSTKEERVTHFMMAFGQKLNLETKVDEIGNIMIKKPAFPGFELKCTDVQEGYLNMVHQKNMGISFHFDGVIKNYIEASVLTQVILCTVGKVWKEYIDKSGDLTF